MDIRPLSPTYAVSPQIALEDLPAIKAAGYTTVLDNRPCGEIPPDIQAAPMGAAAEAAGLRFVVHPVVHTALTPELVAQQMAVIDESDGPVLAYCASGTRSTIVWMLGAAAETPAEELLQAARNAGYALDHLGPQLQAIYQSAR